MKSRVSLIAMRTRLTMQGFPAYQIKSRILRLPGKYYPNLPFQQLKSLLFYFLTR